MRSQAVMDANNKIKQHNDDLAGQIAGLNAQDKTADVLEATKDATGQFWATGKLPGQVKAFQNWNSARTAANPTSQAQNTAAANVEEPPTETETPKLTGGGDGIFESDGAFDEEGSQFKKNFKSMSGLTDEGIETMGKGAGAIAGLGVGGLDIYKDIKSGGIAGDNWASKASNVLQIGGAIADVGGIAFPPLALVGGVADLLGGVAGEIGDFVDSGKQDQATANLQESETQTAIATQAQAPVASGRVS